jgi:hypothetical protein
MCQQRYEKNRSGYTRFNSLAVSTLSVTNVLGSVLCAWLPERPLPAVSARRDCIYMDVGAVSGEKRRGNWGLGAKGLGARGWEGQLASRTQKLATF